MRISKILATVTAAAALVAVGVASVPSKAEAYVIYSRVYAPAPVVVVRPPVVYYTPRPVYVAPPQAVWVPAHYEGPYFVPGHWA